MAGSGNQQNYGIQIREFVVGLSAISGVTVLPYQQGIGIQSVAGGTCFFGGASLALGGSFGLPVPTAYLSLDDYRGSLFLCANGATATVRVLSFLSSNV